MGRRYPPVGERTQAIAAIAALNTFSAAQVEGSKSAAPLGDTDCCSVTHLPRRPQGRTNNARLYFGMDDDGYVYVTARSRAAQRVWPAAKTDYRCPFGSLGGCSTLDQNRLLATSATTPAAFGALTSYSAPPATMSATRGTESGAPSLLPSPRLPRLGHCLPRRCHHRHPSAGRTIRASAWLGTTRRESWRVSAPASPLILAGGSPWRCGCPLHPPPCTHPPHPPLPPPHRISFDDLAPHPHPPLRAVQRASGGCVGWWGELGVALRASASA